MAPFNGLNVTQLTMESVDRVADDGIEGNLTLVQVVSEVVQEFETREMTEAEYEQFLADVWVGVVLTLMVLSCVCCMCSCLLYHKFQQWKRHVLEQRAAAARDMDGRGADNESLPSYTLVSGLPSYEEALEQLKMVQALRRGESGCEIKQIEAESPTSQGATSTIGQNQANQMSRLSVAEFLQLYKMQQQQLPQQHNQQIAIAIQQETAKI
ncbi:protein commissureless 2 homolog [Cephus cinctus]|uniref:Protein commissureless 2 homolog n=1 Tax=Cephus cinctus TaxID=211228 RepID=A0AAJ7BKC5_CEPCN|nr:protein commissureless 2 homolog [Cephus cinctus]